MTAPIKSAFCSVCCQRHFLDIACDPTNKRYTANARALGMADAIEQMTAFHKARGPARARTDDEDLDAAYRDEGYDLTQDGWR